MASVILGEGIKRVLLRGGILPSLSFPPLEVCCGVCHIAAWSGALLCSSHLLFIQSMNSSHAQGTPGKHWIWETFSDALMGEGTWQLQINVVSVTWVLKPGHYSKEEIVLDCIRLQYFESIMYFIPCFNLSLPFYLFVFFKLSFTWLKI